MSLMHSMTEMNPQEATPTGHTPNTNLHDIEGPDTTHGHPHLVGHLKDMVQLLPAELAGAQHMLHVQTAVRGHVTS